MARKSKRERRQVTRAPTAGWLAACLGWLNDLFGRKPRTKDVAKDAAATGVVGELLDRTLDHVDGC